MGITIILVGLIVVRKALLALLATKQIQQHCTKMERSFHFAVRYPHKARADFGELPFLPVDAVRAMFPPFCRCTVDVPQVHNGITPWKPPPNLSPQIPAATSAAVPNKRCGIALFSHTSKLGWHFHPGNTMTHRPLMWKSAFRRYLECGILAHGFARAHCEECGYDFLIAFSCKGGGVCPSCNTRRMVETAAHLADHIFPGYRCVNGCSLCPSVYAITCSVM